MLGDNLDHADEWHVATTLDYAFLEGVSCVTRADDEVDLSGCQVRGHLVESRTAVGPITEDSVVTIGHLGVQLDDGVHVLLISGGPVELAGLPEH